MKKTIRVPVQVYAFANGNVAAFAHDDQQVPEAQEPWFDMLCESLARRYGVDAVLRMRVILPHTVTTLMTPRFGAVTVIPRRAHLPSRCYLCPWWRRAFGCGHSRRYHWTYDLADGPPGS